MDTDYDPDAVELCPMEEYDLAKAKQRASVLWLVSKAHNNRLPSELRDPFYRDHEEQDRLKPQIVQALASAELYCLALANIYADPNYHSLSHQGVVQALQRKGVDVEAPTDGSPLTETVLTQTAPLRMGAHMAVISGIMELYIKEVLIPIKVFEVVRRFAAVGYPEEVPVDAEDAALLWLNKSSIKMRHRIEDHLGTCHDVSSDFRPLVPYIPVVQELSDLNDGCALTALLSFYCPDYLPWEELCLNDPMSLADSLYNLQLVQRFCQTHLPHDVCFLTVEDMLFMHPSIRHNVLALLADLMYIFEIRPPKCVRRPGLRYQEPAPIEASSRQNGQMLRKARARQNSYSHIPDLCANSGNNSFHHNGAWRGSEKRDSPRSKHHSPPVRDDGDSDGVHLSSSPKSRSRSDDDDDLAGYFVRREPLQPARLREPKERTNNDAKHMERGEDETSRRGQQQHDENRQLRRSASRSDARPAEPPQGYHVRRSSSRSELYNASEMQRSASRSDMHHGSPLHRNTSRTDLQNVGLHRSMSKTDLQQTGLSRSASKPDLHQQSGALYRSASKSDLQQQSLMRSPSRTDASPLRRSASRSDASPLRGPRSEPEPSAGRNSGLESYYDHLGGSDADRIQKSAGFPLRREPSMSHILNFSGEKAALEMTDPFETDMFAQHREKKQTTSFAKLSKEGNSSGINIVYMHQQSDSGVPRRKKEEESPAEEDATDSAVAAQLSNIRMKLEERRRKIEQAKRRVEDRVKKQRQKVGKAAFLQVITKGKDEVQEKSPERPAVKESGQPSLREITDSLDNVRRKWLEKPTEILEDPSPDDDNLDLEDCVSSIDKLNMSLTDLDEDLSRLDKQQRAIQSMLHGENPPKPTSRDQFFLHGQGTATVSQPSQSLSQAVSQSMSTTVNQPTPQPPKQPVPQPVNHPMPQQMTQTVPQLVNQSMPQPVHQPMSQPVNPTMPQPVPQPMSQPHIPMYQTPYQQQNVPQYQQPMMQSYQQPYQQPYQQTFQTARRQWGEPTASYPTEGPPRRGQWGPPVVSVAEQRQQWGPPVYPISQMDQQYSDQSMAMYPKHEEYQYNRYSMPPQYYQQNESYATFSVPQHEQPVMQVQDQTRVEAIARDPDPAPTAPPKPEAAPREQPKQTEVPSSPAKKTASFGKTFRVTRNKAASPAASPTDESQKAGFFISFDDEQPKKPKPKLRPRIAKQEMGEEKPAEESVVQHAPKDEPRVEDPGNPGIGFVIGADLVNPDPDAESEMQRRKEMIMLVCLKRKEEQEAKRIAKEQANAVKRMQQQLQKEEQERKREEEKQRRQIILEQYRLRKAQEEAEKNSNPSAPTWNATLTRPKPANHSTARSSSKPRPKSMHVGASSQLGSHHPLSGSQVNLHECRNRAPSPPSTCSADGWRAASDGDAASTTSSLLPYEYTGPKLFVKPTAKSNRGIVLNAINTVLAGAVNSETKAKVVEEINQSDSKHFLILFRDAGCQFRGLYSYNPDKEEVLRLYGVGPKSVTPPMMDLFFKYNSGGKSFTRIHTKHLTVTIDALTIHNSLWSSKRLPRKDIT